MIFYRYTILLLRVIFLLRVFPFIVTFVTGVHSRLCVRRVLDLSRGPFNESTVSSRYTLFYLSRFRFGTVLSG